MTCMTDHRWPRASKPTEAFPLRATVSVLIAAAVLVSNASSAKPPYTVAFNYPDPGTATNMEYVAMEQPMRFYTQKITLRFAAGADLAKVKVSVLPLFNGYDWAVSSRWDDNNLSGLQMRDALASYNCKATWYVNDPYASPEFTANSARLLEGGNSFGGHTLTHPMISYVNRNQMFREVALARARWEAVSDSCVLSHAFSFEEHRNDLEGDHVQKDITRTLFRAGYFSIANGYHHKRFKTDMILCPFMPIDGLEIDDFAQEALRDPYYKQEHPLLTYAMHVWYTTPEAWTKFESQLARYTGNPDWWYCNQNQYAAYRFQYRHSRLTQQTAGRRTLNLTLKRPELLDLNDAVPISLLVEGPHARLVESISCPTADCEVRGLGTDRVIVNVAHDRTKALPRKIGLIENRDNQPQGATTKRDADFPHIAAWLCFEKGSLRLTIANEGAAELSDLSIVFRMPLAFKDGVKRFRVDRIPAHSTRNITCKPKAATDDYKYTGGKTLFLAQVDFRCEAAPARLYATCETDLGRRDFSYPQNGFLRSAAIPVGSATLEQLVQTALAQAGKQASLDAPWTLPNGTQLTWHKKTDNEVQGLPLLDAEVIKLRDGASADKWLCTEPIHYVLQSTIHSEKAQPVGFLCDTNGIRAIILNNENVTHGTAQLRKGDNSIALIWSAYPEHRYRRENGGCYFRLVSPATSRRLETVRFSSASGK